MKSRVPFDCAKVFGSFSFCREAKVAKTILPVCSHSLNPSLFLSLSIALSFSMAFSDEVWKMQTNFLARSTKFSSASTFFLFVVPITFWEGSKYSAKGSSTQQSEQRGGSGGVASCKFVMRKSYKTWVFRVLTKSN